MTSEIDRHEVIIIGAGAAGLSAAQVLGRQQRRTLIVDGGAPRNSRADGIHMYLSRDGFSPLELLSTGRHELEAYPSVAIRHARATSVAGSIDDFTVTLDDGTRHGARRLMLATGQVDQPWDVPGVPNASAPACCTVRSATAGRHVARASPSWVVSPPRSCSPPTSPTAIAMTSWWPPTAHTSCPRPILGNLKALGITVIEEPVAELSGVLDDLTLRFTDGILLARQVVFHRAPVSLQTTLATRLGVDLLPDGYIRVDEFAQTSVPGVAAVGDLARHRALPDGLTLVSQAVADGVRAAVWLEQGLFRAGLPVPLG